MSRAQVLILTFLAVVALVFTVFVAPGTTPAAAQAPVGWQSDPKVLVPVSVGIPAEKLALVDQVMTKAMADKITPGGVILLAKDGKVFYHKAFGLADVNKPATTDTMYKMYSTKLDFVQARAMLTRSTGVA